MTLSEHYYAVLEDLQRQKRILNDMVKNIGRLADMCAEQEMREKQPAPQKDNQP